MTSFNRRDLLGLAAAGLGTLTSSQLVAHAKPSC